MTNSLWWQRSGSQDYRKREGLFVGLCLFACFLHVYSFLLDRLLQYEQVSSDSESDHSSSESEERERDEVRPAKKIKREEVPAGKNTQHFFYFIHVLTIFSVKVTVGNGAGTGGYGGGRRAGRQRAKSGDSEEQVCIARGKDKPCKSKALQGFKYCWVCAAQKYKHFVLVSDLRSHSSFFSSFFDNYF